MTFDGPPATELPLLTVKGDGVWMDSDSMMHPESRLLTTEELGGAVHRAS